MKPSRSARLSAFAAAFSAFLAGGAAGAAETPAAADDEVEALMREAAADDARNAAAQKPAAAPGAAPSATPSPASGGALASAQAGSPSGLRGFAQLELARAYESPTHWSKMLGRVEFGTQGKTEDGLKWKLSARVDYDVVFATTNYYGADVRRDQQFNVVLRENYFDKGFGDWEVRVGRQHVIWGEMVGLFFADVVSARDMREFILPEFNLLRIPQWAIRAEYFRDDFHGELLWIPVATYDETGKPQQPGGKPGSEFFPYQTVSPSYLNEANRPPNWPTATTAWALAGQGLDLSAFYYRSMDASPTFYQQADPTSLIGSLVSGSP